MCVPTNALEKLAVSKVTKVMGAWNVGVTREPSNNQLTFAVNYASKFPKKYVECVWRDGKLPDNRYIVKYWIIVKLAMDPKIVVDRASEIVLSNSTFHERFVSALEGD